MPSVKQQSGKFGEEIAKIHLEDQGYIFLEQNWYCRYGEIDLIMRDDDELVFVEVKLRKNDDFGYPEEMITYQKRRKLQKSALSYIRKKKLDDFFWRFDAVAITGNKIDYNIQHFQDIIRDE